jgi:hypothetical protein
MWKPRQAELAVRHAQLRARSEALRLRAGRQATALERPLALADRVREGLRWLAAHPQWIAVLAAVPVVLRPRRALGWALKLWWGWRFWRRLQVSLPR